MSDNREDLVYGVWEWIIDANNGVGGDVDDLIRFMERSGAPCPDELDEEN
ncbi:MAG TPA: hypothetical protein VLG91_03445 [Streptomyces sp.]|nr:hypothetical protein [Streptomyces sp.]